MQKQTRLSNRSTRRSTSTCSKKHLTTSKKRPLSSKHSHSQATSLLLSTKPFSTHASTPRLRRSLLYIPGSSMKMLAKAPQSGADKVCLDLEDGVSFTSKYLARSTIAEFLATNPVFPPHQELCLRINPVSSDLYPADCAWLKTLPRAPHSIAIPKMDTIDDLTSVLTVVKDLEEQFNSKIELIGMIESPIAVINLPSMLEYSRTKDSNHAHLTALIFGGDDYASAAGCTRSESNHELDFARGMTLLHASANNIAVLDIVCKEFKDTSRFSRESLDSAQKGFTGRQCIHPSQIPLANQFYAPTQDDCDWSVGVIKEYEEQEAKGVGAWTYKGMMIDMPTIRRAFNIYNRAKAAGKFADQPSTDTKLRY